MAPDKRLPIGFKVKIPNVEELQKLSGRMSTLAEGNFRYHYGRLLDLLQVRVNENALTTLAQFYDPPLRCFTFQDFQLAPTLEEFAKILGFDLRESKPYLNLGEEPTMDDLAKALDLGVEEVTSWLVKTKDNGMVIPRKEFILKEGERDAALVNRIKKAWGQVYEKEKEKKNCIAKPPYTQWVKERVAMFRLRYPVVAREELSSPPPVTTITIEEATELKNKVVELEGKNEEMENKYLQVAEKMEGGLLSATDNLRAYKDKIKELEHSYGEVDKFWNQAVKEKKEWRTAHEEQVAKTLEVEKQWRAETYRVREFENLYLLEKTKLEHLQNNVQSLLSEHVEAHVSHITSLKGEIDNLKLELDYRGRVLKHVWADATELSKSNAKLSKDFVELTAFSKAALDDIPDKLEDAEVDMMWHKPPKGIQALIEYCRVLLNTYKKARETAGQQTAI
ncbi:unnamed protein product [Trifolium pratense]|uniref:Uncharacterized protein n=1 Tax=Trifolium pratense TaxID=57577 RepID=A0ACB0LU04_TRIPR|nr:unnamed protein product [Trifolium pratense]